MANDIGSVKGTRGTSMEYNTQPGCGGQKPMPTGKSNPGDTKPPYPAPGAVPMPK